MMIRPAGYNDIHELVRMGRDFHAQTCIAFQTPFDEGSFSQTLTNMITSTNSVVFIAEESGVVAGMAAALLIPSFFNYKHNIAQELFCWVDPEYRGGGMKLFDELETWAEEMGAATMIIASVAGLRDDVLDRKYRSKGFIQTDIFYTKVMPCQVQ